MRWGAAFLFVSISLWGGADDTFLLRNVTVHTVSGPDIAGGAVLVRDGKIEEVGQKVTAPKGMRVMDGKGLHVYPGMIDSATEMGLSEIRSVRESNDANEIGTFNPQLRTLIAVNPASEHIPVTRANGITTVITMPGGGIIAGQAALIHLDGWTWEEMAVRQYAALDLRFPFLQTGGGRGGMMRAAQTPLAERRRTYEKQLADLRDFFESARRYQAAKKAGRADFKADVKMEAMLPVLEGKVPVMVHAARERAIREAIQFAEKQKIRIVLAEPREAEKVAADLKAKDIPVIVPPTLIAPLQEDDPYDKTYALPAELQKAGVKIAFGTFTTSASRNLPYQAAMAVAFGLPPAEALKALTLNPAEIWGIGSEYGSIEKGKWADLMVTDGDPLETRTQVKQVYIKGRAVGLENKHQKLYERYLNRP